MGVESRGASFHTLDLLFIYYLSIDDLLFTTAQNHVILRIFAVNICFILRKLSLRHSMIHLLYWI